ncbi:MAG TPA: M56 family metallopeptidase [Vicinamibacterales bacterium]
MIRATFVLIVAHLVLPRLQRRSASERHWLWTLSLGMAAVLPLLGTVLPSWQPEWASGLADAWPGSLSQLQSWAGVSSADVTVRVTAVESSSWTSGVWAIRLWALGAFVMLLLLARDVARLLRVAGDATAENGHIAAIGQELSRHLGLSRIPTVLVSTRTVMPMTWGFRRPRVLLPPGALDWPHERLRAVLAHEFAHVRRADWLVHLVTQVVCAVYWFHPLFWTAERALARESEQAADDDALGAGLEANDYASHLVAVVRAVQSAVPSRVAAVTMARTVHLERRVAAVLRPQLNRLAVSWRVVVATSSIGLAMVFPLAAMSIDSDRDLSSALVTATPERDPMAPTVRSTAAVRGDETLPAIVDYTTPPLYSDPARRRRIEGILSIAVRIDERGRLTRARVARGLGFGLDQNALVALRQWRFRPGTVRGEPAAMDAEIDIEFNLKGELINQMIANDMVTLVGPGVTPPAVIRSAPSPLESPGANGAVVLDVVLLEDGSPKVVRILRSLTPDADENAVRYFRQWRFSPAMKSGVPVKVRMSAEVRFHD